MSDAPALPPEAVPHLSEADQHHQRAIELAARQNAFSPWTPQHQAIGEAVKVATLREDEAQQRAANAIPPPPERYLSINAPAGGAVAEEGFARKLGLTQDEFGTIESVMSDARMSPLDPAHEMKTLERAFGANKDRNITFARAEVKRLGPAAAAWLEENGIADSAMVTHVILSAARRNGRAPW